MPRTVSEDTIFNALRRVALFVDVSDADLRDVAEKARAFPVKKGDPIFREGSEADGCFVLGKGRAKVVLAGQSGTDVIVGTVEPNELVGELAVIDGLSRSAGLVALEPCLVIRLSRASFDALRNNRAFETRLMMHVASMLRRATEQLRAIYTYSSTERVSWGLARLASRMGRREGGQIVVAPPPTHQQLADMIGCSREIVTRVLTRLVKLKHVGRSTRGYTLDARAFRRYLENEPGAPDATRLV